MRIDSSLIPGSLVIGVTDAGVKGIDLPSTGEDGIAPLYQLANLPAENDVEFRWLILTTPSVGTFFAYEDGSFEWDAPLETVDSFTFEWFKDGVSQGNDTVNVTITETTGVTVSITETFAGFGELITVNTTALIPLGISITEVFDGFSEIINVSVPINITVNPKNIIRVNRKNNIVRVR